MLFITFCALSKAKGMDINMKAQAYGLVRIVYEFYKKGNTVAFLMLLAGEAPCKFEVAPGTGHNIVAVIDAIHEYKKDNPSSDVEKGYQEGLNKFANYATDPESIVMLVGCINYELKKEKDGTNSLKIDCRDVLNTLQRNIKENYKAIQSSMKDFDTWAKEQNEYMESNFGLHF